MRKLPSLFSPNRTNSTLFITFSTINPNASKVFYKMLHRYHPISRTMAPEASKVLIETDDAASSDSEDGEILNSGTDESHLLYVLNLILSGTARLNVLLPTATILAFTIFAPLLSNDGDCSVANRWLTASFVLLCAASCAFFSITDSFRTASGRIYYGVATARGMWTFNARRKAPTPDAARYRLRWADLFHALLSVVAFVTFAGSHRDVVSCYYPRVPRKVINSVPLVVGFAISVLFVVFPSKRRGIGYPFLMKRDAAYLRG